VEAEGTALHREDMALVLCCDALSPGWLHHHSHPCGGLLAVGRAAVAGPLGGSKVLGGRCEGWAGGRLGHLVESWLKFAAWRETRREIWWESMAGELAGDWAGAGGLTETWRENRGEQVVRLEPVAWRESR
jgi:hypothetical protein